MGFDPGLAWMHALELFKLGGGAGITIFRHPLL
jgi:hypothetical protein